MDMRPSWMQGDNELPENDKFTLRSLFKSYKKQILTGLSIFVLVLVTLSGLLIVVNSNDQETVNDILGTSVEAESVKDSLNNLADFPVYYFADDKLPAGLEYVSGSAQYEQGILFYSLTDGNNTIVVSQQQVPEDLAGSIPQGDEKIETSYGNGGISLLPDRTTVNIISDDSIFILVNAPATVDIDTVKTLSRSLSN